MVQRFGKSRYTSDEGELTAEVLIVIVGARGRRGGCGGDGDVRPFLPTSVMVRSATRRRECTNGELDLCS